jgi:hypothetical protein
LFVLVDEILAIVPVIVTTGSHYIRDSEANEHKPKATRKYKHRQQYLWRDHHLASFCRPQRLLNSKWLIELNDSNRWLVNSRDQYDGLSL